MVKRSQRIPDDLSPNRLAVARKKGGVVPFDLTLSNPTTSEVPYPVDLLECLSNPAALTYRPDPHGPQSAREAVASLYRRWKLEVNPDTVTLTASTSEAYAFLLRLLCDPGDAILVPSPSYPLFDQLARLDGVDARTYNLDLDSGWRINFQDLESASRNVRAVVVVHPNNPTGSFVHPEDAHRLVALCRHRNWALIADEVFLNYPLDGGPGDDRTFAAVENCLCFSLGGLSKMVGLPQLKLAWIVSSGPEDLVRDALEGLEFVGDTYLSVASPVALALSVILDRGEELRSKISQRCRANLGALHRLTKGFPSLSVPEVGGGWSAIIQYPAVEDEEELCLRLLTDLGIAVHPGFFYDLPRQGSLVVSLLTPESVFRDGTQQVFEAITQRLAD